MLRLWGEMKRDWGERGAGEHRRRPEHTQCRRNRPLYKLHCITESSLSLANDPASHISHMEHLLCQLP